MVNLSSIWENQEEFNRKLVDFKAIKDDKEEFQKWNNFYTLALQREVSEVLDTVDWKIHRKENKPIIKSNTLEELVDCMKYWMCVCVSYTGSHLKTLRRSITVSQTWLSRGTSRKSWTPLRLARTRW